MPLDGSSVAVFAAGAAAGAAVAWWALGAARRLPHPADLAADMGLHHEGSVWHPHAAHSVPHASMRDFAEDEVLSEHLTRNIQVGGARAVHAAPRPPTPALACPCARPSSHVACPAPAALVAVPSCRLWLHTACSSLGSRRSAA